MDLLEYMRSQDTITQEEWECTFGGKCAGVSRPGYRKQQDRNTERLLGGHSYLAYVDCEIGHPVRG